MSNYISPITVIQFLVSLEEQHDVIRNIKMARDMNPSKVEWEKLGFVFTDIPEDNVLCWATLPEGWSLKATDYPTWYDILDEHGRKRGSMVYKDVLWDRNACMNLENRYKVCSVYVTDDRTIEEVYFGNEDEKLFVAGQIYRPKNLRLEEMQVKYTEYKRLRAMAKQFGDENYPGWESVHAYWNNVRELSCDQVKRIN